MFTLARKFDIIVFNEVLLYLDHKTIFEKYARHLNENGKIIASVVMLRKLMYRLRVANIWKSGSLFFNLTDKLTLTARLYNQKLNWDIKILSPISTRQEK